MFHLPSIFAIFNAVQYLQDQQNQTPLTQAKNDEIARAFIAVFVLLGFLTLFFWIILRVGVWIKARRNRRDLPASKA